MGLFDAYKGATKDMDGNFNEFIPQYIQAKLNGTESFRKCLYSVITDFLGVDPVDVVPEAYLAGDLGCDDLDFVDMTNLLRDRLIFESSENSFFSWVNDKIVNINKGQTILQQEYDLTVRQLEEKIYEGCPLYAVKKK